MSKRAFAAASLLTLTMLGAVACGGDGDDGDAGGGVEVAVTGTDDACEIDGVEIVPGKTTFVFTNSAGDVSELYVYEGTKVIKEVENVITGASKKLTVTLEPGKSYKLTCKPGQKGDGYSTEFTVG